jgi:hypothetical protein
LIQEEEDLENRLLAFPTATDLCLLAFAQYLNKFEIKLKSYLSTVP